LAVLGVNGTSIAAVGVRGLVSSAVCSSIWVVCLTDFLCAIGSRGLGTTRIRSGRWIISVANAGGAVGSVGGSARTIITAVPGGVSVVVRGAVDDSAAMPVTVPGSVAPATTTSTAYRSANRDTCAEGQNSSGRDGRRTVPGRDVRTAVNYRGVVLRNINDLGIGRLNDDDVWRLYCTTVICEPDCRLPAA
jgi:hypothetical protein